MNGVNALSDREEGELPPPSLFGEFRHVFEAGGFAVTMLDESDPSAPYFGQVSPPDGGRPLCVAFVRRGHYGEDIAALAPVALSRFGINVLA